MNWTGWTADKESIVLRMWRANRSDSEIGNVLHCSPDTVKRKRMERRWVGSVGVRRHQPASTKGQPRACGDETSFRSATKVATQMLLERIAEHHPQYKFAARVAA